MNISVYFKGRKLIKVKIFLLLFVFAGCFTFSQNTTIIIEQSDSVAANLDLEAVAFVFGEYKDSGEFEKKLIDPDSKINNHNLNGCAKVDDLRVLEKGDVNVRVVNIQAVLGMDLYQDVATIDVVKDENGETQVQVVGDIDFYSSNYIIRQVYVKSPVIVHFFRSSMYHLWHSPYYRGPYPPYHRSLPSYSPYVYRRNVHVNNYTMEGHLLRLIQLRRRGRYVPYPQTGV